MHPDINRLHVLAHRQPVLRDPRLGHAVDLRHHAVLASVPAQYVVAVLELVLLVAAPAESEGRYDPVRRLARAGVDVHRVEGHGGARVRHEADKLKAKDQ